MLRISINPARENSLSKARNRAELRRGTRPASLLGEPCKAEDLPTRKSPNQLTLPPKLSCFLSSLSSLKPFAGFSPPVAPSAHTLPTSHEASLSLQAQSVNLISAAVPCVFSLPPPPIQPSLPASLVSAIPPIQSTSTAAGVDIAIVPQPKVALKLNLRFLEDRRRADSIGSSVDSVKVTNGTRTPGSSPSLYLHDSCSLHTTRGTASHREHRFETANPFPHRPKS